MTRYKNAQMKLTDCSDDFTTITTTQSLDSTGCMQWTQWHQLNTVQIQTQAGPVGPKVLNIAEKITDYSKSNRILGRQEIYMLGGFVFFEQFATNFDASYNYHNENDGLYLILAKKEEIQAQDLLRNDGKISLKIQANFSIYASQTTNLQFQNFTSRGLQQYSISTKKWTHLDYETFLKQHPNLNICGDAIQITFEWKGQQYRNRWLFPHEDGPLAAILHLINTTSRDDWTAIQPLLPTAHPIEKERVFTSFLSIRSA